MKKIRLLQISDIHWQKQLDAEDDYTDVRDQMLQDLKYYCEATKNNFDKILICGDIAFSGAEEEYIRANKFINELCAIVGCKKTEVYTVPGNHDKNVNVSPKKVREFFHQAMCDLSGKHNWWWQEMYKEDFPFVKKLYVPFENYNKFCNDERDNVEPFMLNALDPNVNSYNEAPMYWHSEFEDDFEGYHIHLYGVNSALTSDLSDYDDSEDRKGGHYLFLPKVSYRGAKNLDGNINILMCHHPLDFLLNKNEIRKDLDSRYVLQLFGHVHIADSEMSNGAIHVYSGSLNPGDINDSTYLPVYNIIELSIAKHEDKDNELIVGLNVRKYNGDTFEEDKKQSKIFKIPLKIHNVWNLPVKAKEEIHDQKLPDGVTKRDVRHLFKENIHGKEIIKEMYPKIDCNTSAYMRNQIFLEKVSEDNRWVELYNKISNGQNTK